MKVSHEWQRRQDELLSDILTRAQRTADPLDPTLWWSALAAAVEHVTHQPIGPVAGLRGAVQQVVSDARDAFVYSTVCTVICTSATDELSALVHAHNAHDLGRYDRLCIALAGEELADRAHTAAIYALPPTAN